MRSYFSPLIIALSLLWIPWPAGAAELDDLGALAWMAGCWEGRGGGGRNQECWMEPLGGIMLGVNRVVSERGTSFEFLRIAPHGEGLALLASPRGKEAVAFTLVESEEGRAVFTNPWHDFPQRLIYQRDGDTMTALVEAQRNGEWRGFDVVWRRIPVDWPSDASQGEAQDEAPAGSPNP